ncbi:MAG TPA: SigE family RNA polymerase sigma factor [Marmoricola sp.]|nr:SigE family RNA polymerase sigma factor [Marmoricola sp.]
MSGRDGFEAFVAARQSALLRSAYLVTGHQQDAEDLVQNTLVKAAAVWGRIGHDPEAYVRRILANENVTRWRRRRWREVTTAELPEATRDEADPDDRLELLRALGALAPRQRAVVVLRYFEDLTERQTAELLGISVGTVKSQARDALARLRERLPGLTVAEAGTASVGA